MKLIKKLMLGLLTVVMAFSMVACGGSKALKGVTETEIWVGNTAGTTGVLQSIGEPFNLGIEAAFAAYNADGGYQNTKQVKLKHYDDGGVAAQSATLTEKLIHEDEVFAIVGNFAATCVAANLPVIKEAEVPMVYAAAGNDVLYNANAQTTAEKGIFPVQPLNMTEGKMLIVRAFAPLLNGGMGATKVGVIADSSEASKTILAGIKEEANTLPESKKSNIVYQEVASDDYSAAVNALKAAGCDTVIVTTIGAPFVTVLSEMADVDYYCKVLTTYNNASAAVFNNAETTLLDSKYEKIFSTVAIYAQAWLDISSATYVYDAEATTPLGQAYKALYEALNMEYTGVIGFNEGYWTVAENIYNYCVAQGRADGLTMSSNSYALAGYIAGDLFCQGLQALEDAELELTRANYVEVMESKEFNVAMADKISFANGVRAGVDSFALTQIFDTYAGGAGTIYHQAASATISGLTSIADFKAMING